MSLLLVYSAATKCTFEDTFITVRTTTPSTASCWPLCTLLMAFLYYFSPNVSNHSWTQSASKPVVRWRCTPALLSHFPLKVGRETCAALQCDPFQLCSSEAGNPTLLSFVRIQTIWINSMSTALAINMEQLLYCTCQMHSSLWSQLWSNQELKKKKKLTSNSQ